MNLETHTTADPSQDQPKKIFNRCFVSIFLANSLMYLSQWMVNSLVAKYADYLGATASMVGIVSSVFALTALLFKIVSGPALDVYNRRIILILAMCVMGISYFGYSASSNVPMLVSFRLFQGCGQAFTATCCLALASDTLPPDQFGTGIGIFSLAQAVMQAIGPTAGLALMNRFGYHMTFVISGSIMVAAALLAACVNVPYKKEKKFKITMDSIFAKEALLPVILIFFLSTAFSVINSFLIIFAGKQGITGNIGLYFTVYACTLLFSRPLIGKLSDRLGMVRVAIPAMFCFALSFLVISFSTTLLSLLTAGLIAGFGYGACQPAIQTLCMKCVSQKRRGAASSSSYIGNDLGQLLGPNVAGAVIVAFGYNAMWRFMMLFIFTAVVLVIIFRKKIYLIEKNFRTGVVR